ncbi:MAG TPA: phosphatase PAP2 family protein [Solirubrobacteraceae bacterium]|nr:phosphatase PAP2 family protein [Solirubrobacteraceae bacterium]
MRERVTSLESRLLPQGRMDALRQLALVATAYYLYRLTRGFVDDPTNAVVAFAHGRDIIALERSLHVFVEPSVQGFAQSVPALEDLTAWMYVNAQSTVTLAALAFLYISHNRSFYFVRNMFMVAWLLAIVGYVVLPTAPPRFFGEWGFSDSVADFTGVDHDSVAVNALFNPYAAVPSMHVGFALMVGIPLARLSRSRVTKVAWSLYPVVVTFVIVATANHFLFDAVAGAVVVVAAGWAAAWLGRVRPTAWAFTPVRA